jgi:hypothetical protein
MLGRAVAMLGLALGVFGLAIDAYGMLQLNGVNAPARNALELFLFYWTYFTHLSNLGVVLVYTSVLTSWGWLGWFRRPVTRAMMAAYIALVMCFFHFMLAPLYDFEGALAIGNVVLHYACPIIYLAWWFAFAPNGGLKFGDIGWMLLPGGVYLMWVLARGAIINEYPYPVLDAGKLGYGPVAVAIVVILIAVAAFGALLVLFDRLKAPKARVA